MLEELLDGFGDLEFAARAGLQMFDDGVDAGREEVHADQREVADELLGFFHEAHDPTVFADGHAETRGVGHACQQDAGVHATRTVGLEQVRDAAVQQVVTQVHHEWVITQVFARDLDGVRESAGSVLQNESEVNVWAKMPVLEVTLDFLAGFRADDHADIGDARPHEILDGVIEVGLVGNWDELLGARVRQWAEPRTLATRENQAFHAVTLPEDRLERYSWRSREKTVWNGVPECSPAPSRT